MRANALVDTGALLAILDRDDRWHSLCSEAFRQLRKPLLTSEAVLTELFYFVGQSRMELETAWSFLRTGAVYVCPLHDEEMPSLQALMVRYADRPMDFADATLVHLARRESVSTILTVDRADFNTYRIEGRRRFQVLPVVAP